MNNLKNKWLFIIAILVIILCIVIFSNKDVISEMIGINTKKVYDSIIASDNDVEICRNKKPNKNFILAAYEYNDTVLSTQEGYCISGTESTCIETECYKDKNVGACPAGTIINYMVSPTISVFFNVLHDDGSTMTLQTQNNIITSTEWYSSKNSYYGPIIVLTAVTNATKNWTHVNELTYSLGTTIFLKNPNNSNNANPYTNCSNYINCTDNLYTLSSALTTNVRARIISTQEAVDNGCTTTTSSCPKWLTKNSNYKEEYIWTINSYNKTSAVIIDFGRLSAISDDSTSNSTLGGYGSRAVVEINK